MPGPALSVYSPLSRCGMPQANSTTSTPRWMSPLASARTLPCSEERSFAALWIGRRPGGLRAFRVGDDLLDFGLAGQCDLGLYLASVRAEHIAASAGRPFDLFSPDEMSDLAHEYSRPRSYVLVGWRV